MQYQRSHHGEHGHLTSLNPAKPQRELNVYRSWGWNVAADNLERFLNGVGGTKTLSVPWLRGFEEVTEAESKNIARFEATLNRVANEIVAGDLLPDLTAAPDP